MPHGSFIHKDSQVYLIPVDEVGATRARLRLTTPKNKNQYGYRIASDYEL
jgi:hypothetical protein